MTMARILPTIAPVKPNVDSNATIITLPITTAIIMEIIGQNAHMPPIITSVMLRF